MTSRLLAIVAGTLIASTVTTTASCSKSAPALPSEQTPTAIHRLLTGQDGSSFLSSISTYPWDDDGAMAAALFEWIGRDADSDDSEDATRAGETAHALARFLSQNESALLNIPSGFLSRSTTTAGAINPALVDAFVDALIPFQGQLVCDHRDTEGFELLEPQCESSVLAARPIFAVLSSEPTGYTEFATAAQSRADRYLAAFADDALPGVDNPTPAALAYIGRLLGLTTAGARRLPDSPLQPPDIDAEIVEVKYALAEAFLAKTPSIEFPVEYMPDGRILSPIDARSQFGDERYYEYLQHLDQFLEKVGNIDGLVDHEVRGQYEFAAGAAAQ